MKHLNRMKSIIVLLTVMLLSFNCDKRKNGGGTNTTPGAEVNWWMTTGSQTSLLQKQTAFAFNNGGTAVLTIDVDSAQKYQSIDGFVDNALSS